MKSLRPIVFAVAAMVLAWHIPAQAEVQKFMRQCESKLCPYYRLVLTPPKGWVIDEEATKRYNVQILVPKGEDFGSAPAPIYVQVSYLRDKSQSLANFAGVSNRRWLEHTRDATITPLSTIPRANGKDGFLRFAFRNPDNKQQAYEMGAFGIDSDKDGNLFVLDVVVTGASKAALDGAEKDYIDFLKAH